MSTVNKRKKYRMIAGLIFVVVTAAIVCCLLHVHTPEILKLLDKGNVTGIEHYIRNEGSRGRLILLFLQVLETVTIVLPSMPVYICAGAVYGKLQGLAMCYITNLVMNLLIFRFARKTGVSVEEFSKFQKNPRLEEWMKETEHPDRLVLLMCLLPIIPNGLIPVLSSQTRVTTGAFLRALAVGCLPGMTVFVCCGDLLLSEHFRITLPVTVGIAVVVCLFLLFRKKIAARMEPWIRKFL